MNINTEKFKSSSIQDAWKYICQLRVQLCKNKASLVLGAGISWDLDLPLWDKLIDRIKVSMQDKAPEVKTVNDAPGKAALVLFEMFCSYRKKEIQENNQYSSDVLIERKILADWREIIHQALYEDTDANKRKDVINKHPYFIEMIEFIKHSELTVNYNFDDYIEYGLSCEDLNPTRNERPYQTVWSHHSQFTKDKCVIYHPNGFLPLDRKKFQSEELIFSDGAFADQLLDGIGGNLSTLLHVLTKKTSVLIGHSLTDSTLLHLLRKASSISPGNYNYYIKYIGENSCELEPKSKSAIFEANFNNYNLITLFFNSEEIKCFLKAITMPEEDFMRISDILGLPTKYNYYLVGAVGTGKSTVVSQFGNLITLDEWFDERPADMALSPDHLSSTKTMTIDSWTNEQFGKKNSYLQNKKIGIYLIDRSPLDPLSFVVNISESERARLMLEQGIRPGKSKMKIASGEIIHMIGDSDEIWSRLITKRKESDWPQDKVNDLQQKSMKIYGPLNPKLIYSTNRKENDVIRDVARIIFSSSYLPSDLNGHMENIANGS